MKIVLFGATGMIGQGVLRECLREPALEEIVLVSRTPMRVLNPREDEPVIEEIIHRDFLDFSSIESILTGFDACFFCLGISSAGMSEQDYTRVTYDYTLSAARTLCRLNPKMTFIYVSGAGTDSTEHGRSMWARVKGRTENALLNLPLNAYMFRPGLIQPMDGIRSRTRAYRILYAVTSPILPFLRWIFPNQVLSTRDIGFAMLSVASNGYPKKILETKDIRTVLRS